MSCGARFVLSSTMEFSVRLLRRERRWCHFRSPHTQRGPHDLSGIGYSHFMGGGVQRTRPHLFVGSPAEAVAEAGVVADVLELRIDIMEFLADLLDEGADIGAKTLVAIAGREVLAVNQVVDLAIGYVLAGTKRQKGDNLELGQREVDRRARPAGAVNIEAQLQTAEMQDIAGMSLPAAGDGRAPAAIRRSRLMRIDSRRDLSMKSTAPPSSRRLLVDVLAEHGEEDHRGGVARSAQAAQHLEPVHSGHAPIEKDDIGVAAQGKIVERRRAAREARDLITLVDQIEAQRFAKEIVVVNKDDLGRGCPCTRSACRTIVGCAVLIAVRHNRRGPLADGLKRTVVITRLGARQGPAHKSGAIRSTSRGERIVRPLGKAAASRRSRSSYHRGCRSSRDRSLGLLDDVGQLVARVGDLSPSLLSDRSLASAPPPSHRHISSDRENGSLGWMANRPNARGALSENSDGRRTAEGVGFLRQLEFDHGNSVGGLIDKCRRVDPLRIEPLPHAPHSDLDAAGGMDIDAALLDAMPAKFRDRPYVTPRNKSSRPCCFPH